MIRIALLGFGNVGRALARHLSSRDAPEKMRIQIFGVADETGGVLLNDPGLVRRILERQERGRMVADCADIGDFAGTIPQYLKSLQRAGVSILVECMPTNPVDGQPALSFLLAALNRRIAVVTVDKGPIVYGFSELRAVAARKGTRIAYSGTTGVRPPPGLDGCRVSEILGVLNGTTNYVLTLMQDRGTSFREALAKAVEQGIAEPNPELDIQGWDTACKILILANQWMDANAVLGDVRRVGIGPETEQLIRTERGTQRVIRLIGRARRCGECTELSVTPTVVGPESVFHPISGTSKGAVFKTVEKGELLASARSGRDAIAHTIVEDILEIAKDQFAPRFHNGEFPGP
jgi:homoserine dehydrogenase